MGLLIYYGTRDAALLILNKNTRGGVIDIPHFAMVKVHCYGFRYTIWASDGIIDLFFLPFWVVIIVARFGLGLDRR